MTARKHQSSELPCKVAQPYSRFDVLDGSHPMQAKAPGTHVMYQVRRRKHGKVCYFNFALAREMGLVDHTHADTLNVQLSKKLLDTFSLIIINEYDLIHGRKFPKSDIKPKPYMATRYLQMQHRSRTGKTSGDGRAIWNGVIEYQGKTWDITSCGTGATCLSPASANNQQFYESGDPSVSYGCGYAESVEAIGNSVFSEILHRNGISTERTLCIIEYPGDFCVIVRAGNNLLRPSHFFNHLKQNHYRRLKDIFDLFLQRQSDNGVCHLVGLPLRKRYDAALEYLAKRYARSCAVFERSYIFCWLDWDGDNMLADGGIIDYGSVRQMGLCHHNYCFDDDARWSTNLRQQRFKGRYIVQTFAQLVDFLKTGVRKSRDRFENHKALKVFDREFKLEKLRILLTQIGIPRQYCKELLARHRIIVSRFANSFEALERWASLTGVVKVPDGLNINPVYDMRSFLRVIWDYREQKVTSHLIRTVHELILSSFADSNDRKLTRAKIAHLNNVMKYHARILASLLRLPAFTDSKIIEEIERRSLIINAPNRVTGDAMYYVGETLFAKRKTMPIHQWHALINSFIEEQVMDPDQMRHEREHIRGISVPLSQLRKIVHDFREGL